MNKFQKDFDLIRKDKRISGVTMHNYQKMISSYINPTIIEERQMNVASMDVFSRLMMDNILFLGTEIYDDVANIITAQLLFMSSSSEKDIDMYINSPGGSVYAGFSIFDTMNLIKPDVATTVTGMAASMGFVLSINGAKGKRRALPHSRLMMHQPLSGAQGQASDIDIVAKQTNLIKKELYEIIVDKTGKTYKQIEKDGDRDFWLSAKDAKEYGAVDIIIGV